MKAYWAFSAWDDDWGFFVHGETVGDAKSRAKRREPSGDWEYIDIRLKRVPTLDDKPFTPENCNPLTYDSDVLDGEDETDYHNECSCFICAAAADALRRERENARQTIQ